MQLSGLPIRHVEDFGIYVEQPQPAPGGRGSGRSSGLNQNFSGPVQLNQAIATDNATQRVGHVGNKKQSQDLTPRQVRQGVVDIEALAVEVEKPDEKRNWKAVLERAQAVLDLASKAVDFGAKLAPYTPAILTLVDQAKHYIK
jgi:hypothetical protein